MGCVYYLNGDRSHPMTELELDDFLTEKGEFASIYKDVVFDFSAESLHAQRIIDTTVTENAKKARREYSREKAEYKRIHFEDETCEFFKPPYYGVNYFLSHVLAEVSGERLYPEFILENYWAKRQSEWIKGEFTDTEKEVIFDNDEAKITEWINKGWNAESEEAIREFDRIRKAVEYKWKCLADAGTEIHKILQLYFLDPNRADLLLFIQSKVNTNIISKAIIELGIEYAKNLKQLIELRFSKYGQLKYYTELDITLALDEKIKGNDAKLLGIIDLLVVDGQGNLHVIDYKTSIKSYNEFGEPKKNAFIYLLATYLRMLQRNNLSTRCEGSAMIAPIEMKGFRKHGTWVDPEDNKEHDKWIFDSIEGFTGTFVDISEKTTSPHVSDNLDSFLMSKQWVTLQSDQLQKQVSDVIKQWFPNYDDKVWSDEDIRTIIKDNKGFTPNDAGNLVFHLDKANFKDIIVKIKGDLAKAEEEMFKKVASMFRGWPEKKANLVQSVLNSLNAALENPDMDIPFRHGSRLDDETGSLQWFKDMFGRYIDNNKNYELLNFSPLVSLSLTNNGIIAILNKSNKLIDFIKISTQPLLSRFRFKDSENFGLLGHYENDLIEQRKTDSLAVLSVYGNIELMELMLIINNLAPSFKKGEDTSVGRVIVVNPLSNRGLSMSNEELVYNYSKLNSKYAVPGDNILQEGSPIKFANRWKILLNQLQDIFSPTGASSKNGRYRFLESCKSRLENTAESLILERILEVENLIFTMSGKDAKMGMDSNPERLNLTEVMLYNNAVLALAELKGIKFRLQIERYGEWFQSTKIWKKGLNSLWLDNPGHMNNDTLNLMAKLTFEWHLGVRDDLTRLKPEIDVLVDNLKNDRGFGKILEYTFGNLASIYGRMTYLDNNGDLMVVNPYEDSFTLPNGEVLVLTKPEREFLKYFLKLINLDRQGNKELALFDRQIKNNDRTYFMLPLVKGTSSSRAAAENKNFIQDLSTGVLNYLKYLNPKYLYREAKKSAEKLGERLDRADSNTKPKSSDDEFFQMTTEFDKGYSKDRLEFIKHPLGAKESEGPEYFERNLETLLLRHKCAYYTRDRVNAGVPLMKAALIHLTNMGTDQNGQYKDEIKYIRDFFSNKIKGESLVDAKFEVANQALTKLRSVASLMTLGVAPVLFFYQLLDGMWKDISLIIRKPDGTNAFTFAHMTAAAKDAFEDMFTFGKKTKSALLNELYGLNDMDMNIYYDRLKSDKWGIYNWRSFAFYFASRPDFYNRLTIFGSQMRADGTDEAHSVKNGKLVYDFSKDKRFNLIATGTNKGSAEYQAQLGLYYTIAKEFIREGAKNADGTLFTLGTAGEIKALPRAYTTKQVESMKSLCDNLYGFYSSERKSMILAWTIGALWMLYRTYWSGKKNQYLQSGGIKLQGKWAQAENDKGEKLYNMIDPETKMIKAVTESELPEGYEKIPTFVWRGDWEEGIALTLTHLINETRTLKNLITAWSKMRNDEEFGQIYRANLDLLLYDVAMFGIIGAGVNLATSEWLKLLKKDKKESTEFIDALALASANVVARSLNNSFLDFNFFESIGQPGISWNPFAFTWATNEVGNLYDLAIGDKTFVQTLVAGSGSLKQTKPIWEWVDVQLIHNGNKKEMPLYKKRHKSDN